RKNPLPTPLAVGIRIRALDGMGERHAARSCGKIPFVQGFDFVEVLLKRLPHYTGQDRVAVFNFRKLKLRTGRALIYNLLPIRKFSLLQDDFGKCESPVAYRGRYPPRGGSRGASWRRMNVIKSSNGSNHMNVRHLVPSV